MRQKTRTEEERVSLAKQLEQIRASGKTLNDAVFITQINKGYLGNISHKYGIGKWPTGAAARDQSGENNPSYKDGMSRGTVNRTTKKVLLAAGKDLSTCERCQAYRKLPWPRHHIDRDRSNNSPENLEVLCCACHNKEHMPERNRDELGRLVCRTV